MKKSTYSSLLDCFTKGHTSFEEELELSEWLQSEESKEEVNSFYYIKWIEASQLPMSHEQQDRIYFHLKEQIHNFSGISKKNGRRFNLRRWVSYAALVAVCVSVGIASHFLSRKERTDIAVQAFEYKEYTVFADKGQRATLVLPDSTKVWLNSHTTISYSNLYGVDERKVSLNGEAWFEVARDEEKRFIVDAGELEIEALGTSFNVRAYKEDKNITTTLFEGKVRAVTGNQEVILLPDQYASFDRLKGTLSSGTKTNPDYAGMWRRNELAFERTSLGDIAILLNRMYNVHIEFGSERVKRHRFSGVIKNNSLDNVIEIISLTAPISYRSSGDTIILRERTRK